METEDLEKKFNQAMKRWEIAFNANNGNMGTVERELSRVAFDHYHRWQMFLKDEAGGTFTREPTAPIQPLRQRPWSEQQRNKELDEFWKSYGDGDS